MNIADTLQERGSRYGDFEHHARIAQNLQDVMRCADGWENLAADQKQALSVIADKIARMLNGDPSYIDNWHDIIGYATLVEKRMLRDQAPKGANDNLPSCDKSHFCKSRRSDGYANANPCSGCPRV